jgi:uncharacterized protein with HEPN domain
MTSERPTRLRLLDILNAIAGIEQALAGKTLDDYRASDVLQRAVERWLEIISEASRYMPDAWKEQNPEIPWKAIAEFGNVARHAYQAVSAVRVWETATSELATLKEVCERHYEKVKHPADPWPDAEPR